MYMRLTTQTCSRPLDAGRGFVDPMFRFPAINIDPSDRHSSTASMTTMGALPALGSEIRNPERCRVSSGTFRGDGASKTTTHRRVRNTSHHDEFLTKEGVLYELSDRLVRTAGIRWTRPLSCFGGTVQISAMIPSMLSFWLLDCTGDPLP